MLKIPASARRLVAFSIALFLTTWSYIFTFIKVSSSAGYVLLPVADRGACGSVVPVAAPFVSIVDAQLYGHDTKQIEAES